MYLLGRFLPLSCMVGIARLQGRILFHLRRRAAADIERNLGPVLARAGSSTRARTAARRFFEGQQIRLMLLHLTQRMDRASLEALFPVDGLGQLDAAVKSGRGALLLLSHLNSLGGFVAVILLRRLGYDVRVAIPENRDPWKASSFRELLYHVEDYRPESILESLGAFYCQFNIRPIVSALRENAIVAQTGDGWHSAAFVDVAFLGRTVPFTNGVMSIARRTGSLVVPLFVTGSPPSLRFVIEPAFGIEDERQLDSRVAEYAGRLEAHLLERPETWQHFSVPEALATLERWRERPLEERYEL